MESLILQHIDTWTAATSRKTAGRGNSASNIQLTGIQKLRELILELAVRGKLVPQDPNDEPASELLKKIAIEKKKTTKENKVKKSVDLSGIGEKIGFEIPRNWKWTNLQEVSNYIQRGKSPKYSEFGKVLVISQKCIQWKKFDLSQAKYIDDKSLVAYQKERYLQNLDILWNSTGTGTVGRVIVIDEIGENELVADSHVTIIRPLIINSHFLLCYLSSALVQSRIDPKHEKTLVSGTTNQVELSTSSVLNLQVPLPPLSEQHRIVAKVDELMALCDLLEKEQSQQLEAHETLVETLLTALTRATDATEFRAMWLRIQENFDSLFTTENSVDKLKQTILQLAVMGKLVPQDPNDEPASELLKKIAVEKARLVKEGKIKKQAPLPEITDEEKPFELPKGWEWVRLGNLINIKSELVNSLDYPEIDQVAPDSIEKSTGKLLFRRTVTEAGVRGPNNKFYKGQILYSKIRPSLSKAIIAPFDGICSADMYPIESMINSEFLLKEILSDTFLSQVKVAENRIKMPKLNVQTLSDIMVTLPPKLEQQHVVDKVEEVFALCDRLKEEIKKAQEVQNMVAEEIVKRVVR